jgi:hypothetical protein
MIFTGSGGGETATGRTVLGAAVSIAEGIGRTPETGGSGPSATRADGVAYDWEARAVKQVLQEAARRLGPKAWNAALDEGRGLDVDEAHAFAAEWTAPTERQGRLR